MQADPGAVAGPTQTSQDSDFDRLFRLSLDLMCVAGLDGYFRRVNPSWTRVLGWTEAELLARPIHEFMHPEDRARTLQARAELARGRALRHFENRYLCKDGSHRWLSWQSITEPGAPLVFAVARDITEQRAMDEERLILGKLESTGLFASGLAHDFNNLLTSLLLNVDLIGLSGPLAPEQQKYLQQAKETMLTAKGLTQQLLLIAGKEGTGRETGSIAGLVRQAAELALRGSGLDCACEIAPDLWPVGANGTQLTHVLQGLILNAREAAPAGGTVRLRAENLAAGSTPLPAELPAGDYVRVAVSDDGPGIPPEVLPRIFDPYFSTKHRGAQKGMGLSLTICRALLRQHGGAITVESAPGRGTTVAFLLPAHPPPGTS